MPLRRVLHPDPETGKHYVFIMNYFVLSAKTIAEIYKQRLQIELFFSGLKKIKDKKLYPLLERTLF
jgi:putative transposase